MDKLIAELVSKVGLDEATAQKVVSFLEENLHRIPEFFSGDAAKGVLGQIAGGLEGLLKGGGEK